MKLSSATISALEELKAPLEYDLSVNIESGDMTDYTKAKDAEELFKKLLEVLS